MYKKLIHEIINFKKAYFGSQLWTKFHSVTTGSPDYGRCRTSWEKMGRVKMFASHPGRKIERQRKGQGFCSPLPGHGPRNHRKGSTSPRSTFLENKSLPHEFLGYIPDFIDMVMLSVKGTFLSPFSIHHESVSPSWKFPQASLKTT